MINKIDDIKNNEEFEVTYIDDKTITIKNDWIQL
jgi:hypothetical protein